MKRSLFIILFAVSFFSATQTFSQSKKDLRQQQKYLTSYEKNTLAGNDLPVLMPYNRWVDPAGEQLYFGDKDLENHALDCALSPDGKWIAVEGRYSVVIIDPATKKVATRFILKSYFTNDGLINTYSGISWRKTGNGYELYWSALGKTKSVVVQAAWDEKKISVLKTFSFETVKPAGTALPNEALVTEESGSAVLYVVLNGNNTVEKLDITTGKTLWSAPAGVAPFGITAANGKLYVTNWAGSVPEKGDADVAGVPWGLAKVDPETGATREGTVSVFDCQKGAHLKEITVGLHPNDIIASGNRKFVYVANANSDLVSVINTEKDELSEQISVRLSPDKNNYFGDSPNGLALTSDDATLYVANGMDNALAVVSLGKLSSLSGTEDQSKVSGFIPTGAYPGGIAIYRDALLFVANIEAEGSSIPTISEKTGKASYNSHRLMASVSVIPVPEKSTLQKYTAKVEKSNQLFRLALTEKLPRKNAAPAPVPLRIGEPSVFKHVVYIIKENRTYDQVLGDVKAGDGDSSLCVFGKKITPNTHKIVNEFQLLDNYYASGKCSAEGHQWTDMGIVTDYVEKNVRAWIRSYPHVQTDALVYAPTGFIWDHAMRAGKSVRIYGEACDVEFDEHLNWTSIYDGFLKGEKFNFTNKTTIKPVEKILSQNFPSSDDHRIPDVLRAKAFIGELNSYDKMEGDQWPELMVMALSNDHTSGTRPGLPTPRAFVADNDLALGQMIEAISKSRFWKNTVIFITEDDSQDGWDHVSAYRTVGAVVSPYSRLKETVKTNYNQVSLLRTIEQILGIPPMNISDATAMPMFNCFSATPDFSPFYSVPNEIPLNEMNKPLSALKGTELHYAKRSLEPQFDHIDQGNDELFNRIIWFAMKGKEPYPGK
ncbi:MAG: bifunctional YncE family protein/alkaline phosphatase family protein [Bacteroidota bacterium]|nr:bifunctional YncE family protein/alkaline phosphatase family protein [Bacteroidota bacterium]